MNILLFLDVFREKNQLEVLCLYPLRNFSMHITFNKGSANTGYSVLAPLSRAGFLSQSLVICSMQERHCRPLVAVFLNCRFFWWTNVNCWICKQNIQCHLGFTSEMPMVSQNISLLLLLIRYHYWANLSVVEWEGTHQNFFGNTGFLFVNKIHQKGILYGGGVDVGALACRLWSHLVGVCDLCDLDRGQPLFCPQCWDVLGRYTLL